MIGLALDTEEQMKRLATGPMGNPQQMPQAAPLQKGMGEQMTDMAKQRAMSGALDAGQAGITSALTSSAPVVASGVEGGAMLGAGTGGMAAIGTAMPYVGAGLMAGKMLGLFNRGGQVGPLSAQYAAEGTMSREQAMALMNNQPEPVQTMPPTQSIPMPQSRPINFPDPEELLMEMSMPQPRPQLQDPYGADRTFSPYDMLRPDNAPNT